MADANDNMQVGTTVYQILRPTEIINTDGTRNYALVGVTQDLVAGMQHIAGKPDHVLMFCNVIARSAPIPLTPPLVGRTN